MTLHYKHVNLCVYKAHDCSDEYLDEDELDNEEVPKRKAKPKRRLDEIFEPALIEERHLSDTDTVIKQTGWLLITPQQCSHHLCVCRSTRAAAAYVWGSNRPCGL